MKLFEPIFCTLALSISGAICANEPCGNNVKCASECTDGLYHVAQVNGIAQFACVLDRVKVRSVDKLGCADPYTGKTLPAEYTEEACNKADGTLCDAICFIPNKDKTKLRKFLLGCSSGASNTLGAVALDELPAGCEVSA